MQGKVEGSRYFRWIWSFTFFGHPMGYPGQPAARDEAPNRHVALYHARPVVIACSTGRVLELN
jgi:hypothetical protein